MTLIGAAGASSLMFVYLSHGNTCHSHTLQHAATHVTDKYHVQVLLERRRSCLRTSHTATHVNHTHCNTRHHTHCNTLQHMSLTNNLHRCCWSVVAPVCVPLTRQHMSLTHTATHCNKCPFQMSFTNVPYKCPSQMSLINVNHRCCWSVIAHVCVPPRLCAYAPGCRCRQIQVREVRYKYRNIFIYTYIYMYK